MTCDFVGCSIGAGILLVLSIFLPFFALFTLGGMIACAYNCSAYWLVGAMIVGLFIDLLRQPGEPWWSTKVTPKRCNRYDYDDPS